MSTPGWGVCTHQVDMLYLRIPPKSGHCLDLHEVFPRVPDDIPNPTVSVVSSAWMFVYRGPVVQEWGSSTKELDSSGSGVISKCFF